MAGCAPKKNSTSTRPGAVIGGPDRRWADGEISSTLMARYPAAGRSQRDRQGRPVGRLRRALGGKMLWRPALQKNGDSAGLYGQVIPTLGHRPQHCDGGREARRRHPEVVDLSQGQPRFENGRPIYARSAAYGHFGRDPEADGGFSWGKRIW